MRRCLKPFEYVLLVQWSNDFLDCWLAVFDAERDNPGSGVPVHLVELGEVEVLLLSVPDALLQEHMPDDF